VKDATDDPAVLALLAQREAQGLPKAPDAATLERVAVVLSHANHPGKDAA
jgi:hypothetical protein